jgi:Delta3-Delta2-enoyl-CoA isomerase
MVANENESAFEGLVLRKSTSGVAHISVGCPPANTLNLPLWKSLLAALRLAECDQDISVLVISSSLSRPIFSAGNDISELHAPSTTRERFIEFWVTSTTFLTSLYMSPLYTVAAIRGACPAGGCVIALCCDYRISLADGLVFGLNESALGIPVPKYWARLMLTVGARHRSEVERMLFTGTMVGAEAALRLGFVDRIVEGDLDAETITHAAGAAQAFRSQGAAADAGRKQTKHAIRGDFGRDWSMYGHEEARESWALLSSQPVSDRLGQILRKLRRNSRVDAKL